MLSQNNFIASLNKDKCVTTYSKTDTTLVVTDNAFTGMDQVKKGMAVYHGLTHFGIPKTCSQLPDGGYVVRVEGEENVKKALLNVLAQLPQIKEVVPVPVSPVVENRMGVLKNS